LSKTPVRSPRAVIESIVEAINTRDLSRFLAHFDERYVSQQPLHRERDFVGVERVETNWRQNLEAMADLRWDVLDLIAAGEMVATELRWSGTRASGERWAQQGVIIYTVRDGLIVAGRLYVEPVT
jgi:ketosteroid isomerase-like protein